MSGGGRSQETATTKLAGAKAIASGRTRRRDRLINLAQIYRPTVALPGRGHQQPNKHQVRRDALDFSPAENPAGLVAVALPVAAWIRQATDIEVDYAYRKLPTDPPTYAEDVPKNFPNPRGRAAATLIHRVIDDPQLGNFINRMRWMVLVNSRPENLLLTSDRPVVITNGIAHENAQILIPISRHQALLLSSLCRRSRPHPVA
jgi:hypothetical protein